MPAEHLSFNLTNESWIPIIDAGGQIRELSLREALLQSHEIADLAVEPPTMEPPLVRLMLAVLSRALDGPRTLDDWENLWNAQTLPQEPVTTYLDAWQHRFELFDDEAPFMQAAGLRSSKGEIKTTAVLLPHWPTGNNAPLFILATEEEAPALTAAEAARWLLHVHAWDTAGLKTAASDDPTARGGKTYGNPTGPLGSMNVVLPKGKTLRETLLFNLIPRDQPVMVSSPNDLPVWERAPMTGAWAPERTPEGSREVFCWPSRRVRLIPPGAGDATVTQVVLTGGDRLDLTHLQGREPHAAWQRSQKAEKEQQRRPVYRPVGPQPERQTWETLDSLLALHDAGQVQAMGRDAPGVIGPTCLWFLSRLEDEGILNVAELVVLRTVGLLYGTQRAVVDECISDALTVPLAVMSGKDPTARQRTLRMVDQARACGDALAAFARNVAEASGDSETDRIKQTGMRHRRALYRTLNPLFRRALTQIASDEAQSVEANWTRSLHEAVEREAYLVISEAPSQAHTHREKPIGRTFAWFQTAIDKALATHRNPRETS